MPRAKSKNAPGLEILLHPPLDPSNLNPQPSPSPDYDTNYHPNSNITGTVVLTSTSDIPIGSVHVVFYGRAKVKIWQSHGQSSAEYRSRANFFSVSQKLFEAGYTFKPGKWEWPFSLTCPSAMDPKCVRGQTETGGKAKVRFKPRPGYLDTHEGLPEEEIATKISEHELPPAMRYYHGMLGRRVTGFIEYVVAAVVIEPESGSGSGGGIFGRVRGPKKRVSTRIIDFSPSIGDERLAIERSMTTQSFHPVIKTSKLATITSVDGSTIEDSPVDQLIQSLSRDSNPDIKGGDTTSTLTQSTSNDPVPSTRPSTLFSRLSLSSPTSSSPPTPSYSTSIFSRSNTPRLSLDVAVSFPTTIQVGSPRPIPFSLSITPNTSTNATTLAPTQLPRIWVKSFSLTLVCSTKVRAHGMPGEDYKTVDIDICDNVGVNQVVDLSNRSGLVGEDARADDEPNLSSTNVSEKDKKSLDKKSRDLKGRDSKHPPPTLSPTPTTTTTKTTTIPLSPSPSPSQTINLSSLTAPHIQSAIIGRIPEPLLIPSFSTYNITRLFGLRYTIDLEILGIGKSERIKGEIARGGILVLGASSELVRKRAVSMGDRDGDDDDEVDVVDGFGIGYGVEDGEGEGEGGNGRGEGALPPGYAEVVEQDADEDENANGNAQLRQTIPTKSKQSSRPSRLRTLLTGSRNKDEKAALKERDAAEGHTESGGVGGGGDDSSDEDDVLPLYTR